MVIRLFTLIILLVSFQSYALTKVTASVDQNPVGVNQSLLLTVVADDSVDNNALDTTPLLKDFVVGRTSVSSQTSMINFDTTHTTTWKVVLMPKRHGQLTIPALTVAGKQSAPIKIIALKADEAENTAQQDVYITNTISANNVYVQQQLTLIVKLHFAVNLKRGSLSDPKLTGANISQVGKDKDAEQIINGRRYRVIERIYSITPQESGEVILESPVFSGEVLTSSSRQNNFFSYANTKPVSIKGKNISLSVKAIPQHFTGDWLPSEIVTLHEQWQPDPAEFKVGEPITRTITLTAQGIAKEQLPKLTMTVPAGLKVYPDQAQLHSGFNNKNLVSQKVINFAIVASKTGKFTLPKMSIDWWNTVTNRAETATLPAKTIVIKENPDFASGSQAPIKSVNMTNSSDTVDNSPSVIINNSADKTLQWLFLALWLLTSLAWFISAKRPQKKIIAHLPSSQKNDNVYLALLAACKQNNGELALQYLLPWANAMLEKSNNKNHKTVTTLDDIHQQFNEPALSTAINNLQKSYFSQNKQTWHGTELLKAIQIVNKNSQNNSVEQDFTINPN